MVADEHGFSFSKSLRLLAREDFAPVYRSHDFAADDVLVIRSIRNQTQVTRLGLSVSKKVGNAVERNRWKRRIREAFRLQYADFPCGLDIVVRPKKGATLDTAAIHRSLGRLLARLDKKMD